MSDYADLRAFAEKMEAWRNDGSVEARDYASASWPMWVQVVEVIDRLAHCEGALARSSLDVERLAPCLEIEGYPWEDQSPPGWQNRAYAVKVVAEYARRASEVTK